MYIIDFRVAKTPRTGKVQNPLLLVFKVVFPAVVVISKVSLYVLRVTTPVVAQRVSSADDSGLIWGI